MQTNKIRSLKFQINIIAEYSRYIDTLSRLINVLTEFGDTNLNHSDMPTLIYIQSKLAYRMHLKILKLNNDIEFLK